MGITLRSGAVRYNPQLIYVSLGDDGRVLKREGYIMEMLKELESALNFTAQLRVASDNKIGGLNNDNQSWNGMVGMLVRDEIDMATFVTQTLWRTQVVDYSIPLLRKASTLIASRKTATTFWVYGDIFMPALWAASFTLLAVFILAFSALEHNALGWTALLNGISLSCKLVLQLSMGIAPKRNSAKVLLLVSSMASYLIFVYYTSDLTATMVSEPVEPPIRSFRDVIERNFKVLARLGTSSHEVLKTATEGSDMRRVYENMADSALVEGTEEALCRVAAEEKTLWWGGTLNIIGKGREYMAIRMEETTYSHLGFGFKKNSELRDLFSYQIQKLEESGVKDKLWKKWTSERSEDFAVMRAEALGYDNTLFVFTLLSLAVPISVCILSVEVIVFHLLKKYFNKVNH